MSTTDGLFWYPAIHYSGMRYGKFDKGALFDSYVRYFLARLQCMFKYENLPDTIPAKWLESYLITNGNALIGKAEDGNLYAFFGGYGGDPDAYYIPTKYIVANPYLNLNKTFKINEDSILIYNDTYAQGVLPMLEKYCSLLVESDVTMRNAIILARASLQITCADDKTKASAELYLKRLVDGDLSVMAENAFIEGLKVNEFSAAANSLTNLIENHQYIKASLYNELGLNSNYNMKRESINSNESQLNDDMLHPLIDDMLKERQEGIDRVNKMFGLDIKVSFDSAWLENEKEEQLFIEQLETDTETAEEVTEDVADVPEDVTLEDTETVTEDTEDVEEVPDELTEVVEDLAEDLMQVIEVAADVIEDNIEGVNEDERTEDDT